MNTFEIECFKAGLMRLLRMIASVLAALVIVSGMLHLAALTERYPKTVGLAVFVCVIAAVVILLSSFLYVVVFGGDQ